MAYQNAAISLKKMLMKFIADADPEAIDAEMATTRLGAC